MSPIREDAHTTTTANSAPDSELSGGKDGRDGAAAGNASGDLEASPDAAIDERIVPASNDHYPHLGNRGVNPSEISNSAGEARLESGEVDAGMNARDVEGRGGRGGKGITGHVRDRQPPRQHESLPPARPMVPDKEDGEVGGASVHALKNYASRDSGAVILESSAGSKGMSNLLVDDLDQYAISPCEEKQWAVFGLSEDIMVRTIKVISHEKYSSLVKEFQVLASPTYPVNEWLDLGTFTAKYTQGEQTFEVPEPAFARYLKFKFISHYGREFYCTVSQVKVHGSTMLESFQHEWQQSSAEIREVQDFMMTKKETKHSANAANGSTGDNLGRMSPEPTEVTGDLQTPASDPNGTIEGAVQHRPHAASAAKVPSSADDRKAPTAVEQAVDGHGRGVPSEMVVPTITCSGTIGTDGMCRENTFVGKTESVAGAGDEDATSLAPGVLNSEDRGASAADEMGVDLHGTARESVEGERTGEGTDATWTEAGHSQRRAGGNGVVGSGVQRGSQVHPEERIRRQEASGQSAGAEILEENMNVGAAASENVAAAAEPSGSEPPSTKDVTKEAIVDAMEGMQDESESRKGIIHSTMEALSKAVHLSDGKKRKGDDAKLDEANSGGFAEGGDNAVPGVGESAPTPTLSPPSSKAGVEATGGGKDAAVLEMDEMTADDGLRNESSTSQKIAEGSASAFTVDPRGTSEATVAVNESSPPPDGHADEAGQVRGGEDNDKVKHEFHPGDEQDTAREAARSAAETGLSIGSETPEHRGRSEEEVSKVEEFSVESHTGSVERDRTSEAGDGVESFGVEGTVADNVSEGSDEQGKEADRPLDKNESVRSQEQAGRDTATATSNLSRSAGGFTAQDYPSESSATVQRQAGLTRLEMASDESGRGSLGDVLDLNSGAELGSEEPAQFAGTDAATLAAKCLDRMGFSEFQNEVLARTQQAQYSAGNSVMVGGQYESIFKTLTNKIKTLEINQSLFNLYLDEVHSCYQEVISLMLAEQARARATRSELLNIQSASLTKMGNHWPAFQELQGKVVEMEQRLLLGSMAWFLSILCLLLMLSNCCFKMCGSVSRAFRRHSITEGRDKGERKRNGRKSSR